MMKIVNFDKRCGIYEIFEVLTNFYGNWELFPACYHEFIKILNCKLKFSSSFEKLLNLITKKKIRIIFRINRIFLC